MCAICSQIKSYLRSVTHPHTHAHTRPFIQLTAVHSVGAASGCIPFVDVAPFPLRTSEVLCDVLLTYQTTCQHYNSTCPPPVCCRLVCVCVSAFCHVVCHALYTHTHTYTRTSSMSRYCFDSCMCEYVCDGFAERSGVLFECNRARSCTTSTPTRSRMLDCCIVVRWGWWLAARRTRSSSTLGRARNAQAQHFERADTRAPHIAHTPHTQLRLHRGTVVMG